jgi:hypothetical protein
LRRQLQLAMELLDDHLSHRSLQIPYHTISVLTAAVLYHESGRYLGAIAGIGTSDTRMVEPHLSSSGQALNATARGRTSP